MASALSGKAVVVYAGAAAGPARAAAAEGRRRQRRGRRGVADAHFAEADQIAVRRHGVMAGCDGCEEFGFGERRALR